MSKFRLKIHPEGFNAVRKSPELQADLHRRAAAIAAAAGGGEDFQVIDSPSGTRARVVVITATEKAKAMEAAHRALTRALDAGRG